MNAGIFWEDPAIIIMVREKNRWEMRLSAISILFWWHIREEGHTLTYREVGLLIIAFNLTNFQKETIILLNVFLKEICNYDFLHLCIKNIFCSCKSWFVSFFTRFRIRVRKILIDRINHFYPHEGSWGSNSRFVTVQTCWKVSENLVSTRF